MTRHRLDDSNWSKIYACLKITPGIYAGHEDKCRTFVDAGHWIMRTGAQWRDLPSEFGKWNTVFKRFARWSDKSVWDKLHQHFIKEPDLEWLLIDSTVVRAHPCAAGAIPLLEGFDFAGVMADRGYDADDILDFIAQNDAEAVIPAKKNRIIQRDIDWYTYKERHLVECFMNKIKQYRRIFSRFEKYASRYMSFLSFASALIWLR